MTAANPKPQLDLFEIIDAVLTEGSVLLPNGCHKPITGGISLAEALELASLIEMNAVRRTVETGVAFGVSTLAICAALKNTGAMGALHVGIDPDQRSQHEGAALAQLDRFGSAACRHRSRSALSTRGRRFGATGSFWPDVVLPPDGRANAPDGTEASGWRFPGRPRFYRRPSQFRLYADRFLSTRQDSPSPRPAGHSRYGYAVEKEGAAVHPCEPPL